MANRNRMIEKLNDKKFKDLKRNVKETRPKTEKFLQIKIKIIKVKVVDGGDW